MRCWSSRKVDASIVWESGSSKFCNPPLHCWMACLMLSCASARRLILGTGSAACSWSASATLESASLSEATCGCAASPCDPKPNPRAKNGLGVPRLPKGLRGGDSDCRRLSEPIDPAPAESPFWCASMSSALRIRAFHPSRVLYASCAARRFFSDGRLRAVARAPRRTQSLAHGQEKRNKKEREVSFAKGNDYFSVT